MQKIIIRQLIVDKEGRAVQNFKIRLKKETNLWLIEIKLELMNASKR